MSSGSFITIPLFLQTWDVPFCCIWYPTVSSSSFLSLSSDATKNIWKGCAPPIHHHHWKLWKVQTDEECSQPIFDPAIWLLYQHTHTTGGHVTGSDPAWYQLISQTLATSIMLLNPPSLWISIYPCDFHDSFISFEHQDNLEDPFQSQNQQSACSFYSRSTWLSFCLFWSGRVPGWKILHHKMKWRSFWKMQICISKSRPLSKQIFTATFWGLNQLNQSRIDISNEVSVAYSQPPKLGPADYNQKLVDLKWHVAWSKNLHTCKIHHCLIPDKKGVLICKQQAPFKKAPDDFIHESGHWGPKCLYEWVHEWNGSLNYGHGYSRNWHVIIEPSCSLPNQQTSLPCGQVQKWLFKWLECLCQHHTCAQKTQKCCLHQWHSQD